MRADAMYTFVSKTPVVIGRLVRAAMDLSLLVGITGCSTPASQGDTSSYLTIMSIVAAQGAAPETTGTTLASDVRTFGTAYADPMIVTMRLNMKDPLVGPSPTNFITVQKYKVSYTRADGGPVPESFETAATFTVALEDATSGPIVLVRAQAKNQSPLLQLVGKGSSAFIPATAQVTFTGVDQAGKATTVTGYIAVSFADWDDPGGDPITPQASFTVAPSAGLRAGQNAIARHDAAHSNARTRNPSTTAGACGHHA